MQHPRPQIEATLPFNGQKTFLFRCNWSVQMPSVVISAMGEEKYKYIFKLFFSAFCRSGTKKVEPNSYLRPKRGRNGLFVCLEICWFYFLGPKVVIFRIGTLPNPEKNFRWWYSFVNIRPQKICVRYMLPSFALLFLSRFFCQFLLQSI